MKKMNLNVILHKCAIISGWILLVMIIIFFISGYALVHEYGFDRLMNHKTAWHWHSTLAIPFLILLFLHVFPAIYFKIRKILKKFKINSR
jgi:hypothetical protein